MDKEIPEQHNVLTDETTTEFKANPEDIRILIISDVEDEYLWSRTRENAPEVDLILSCGDLDPDYLQYLVTMFNCPLLYVHGNHDTKYAVRPPLGCICIENMVYRFRGLRILGLGGSYRYRQGSHMYTETEMFGKFMRAMKSIMINRGFDIMLTHAPARGVGDMEDLPHRGFSVFNRIIQWFRPEYHFHGHVHKSYGDGYQRIQVTHGGTVVINGYRKYFLDISEPVRNRHN